MAGIIAHAAHGKFAPGCGARFPPRSSLRRMDEGLGIGGFLSVVIRTQVRNTALHCQSASLHYVRWTCKRLDVRSEVSAAFSSKWRSQGPAHNTIRLTKLVNNCRGFCARCSTSVRVWLSENTALT